MITHKELLETFEYRDGNLYWRIFTSSGKIKPGDRAGHWHGKYRAVIRHKKLYWIHHLVWFYHYGVWPSNCIDHVNRDRSNNSIENLREATYGENAQNKGVNSNNKSGYTGVYKCKHFDAWMARITHNYKVYASTHDTMEEAIQARAEMKKKYHTFNPVDPTR